MTASTHRGRFLSLSVRAALALFFTTVFASSASAQALNFTVSNVNCDAPGCTGFQFGAAIGTVNFFFTPSGGSGTGYLFSITPGFSNVPGLRVRNRPYPMPTNFPGTATGGIMGVLNTTTGSPFATSIRLTDSTGAFIDKALTITVTDLQILTNPTVPRPIVGVPYDLPLTAFGLVGAPTWSAPGLANGLSLTAPGHEGHIWGTPAAAGTFNAVMNVNDDANGNARGVSFTIVVNPFDILGPNANNALPDATVNAPYSATITAPNCVTCVFTITQGSVPGLTLATNGVLSGTPTNTSSGNTLSITATGTNGVALENFLLRVNSAAVQPLQITSNPVITNTVGISSNISVFSFGGTPPYTVAVFDDPNDPNDGLPPGISLVPDGGTVSTTLTPGLPMLTGRAMVRGTYHFTLKVTDAVGVTAYRTFTWNASRLNFGFSNLPLVAGTLQTGQPYTQQLLGLGGSGTYKWTALGQLPGGLSLDSNTGTISGTLTDTSNISTSILLEDVNNAANFIPLNLNFNITGPPGNTNLNINGLNNITTVTLGGGFSTNLTGSGGTGPYTITVNPGSTLPPGFAFVSGSQSPTGAFALLGTALEAGTFDFTLKVTDSSVTPNTGVRTFRMVVTTLNFLTTQLKPGAVGVPYSQRVVAVGGTAPITYSLDTGFTMPAGLNPLAAGGNITGTPTQESSQALTFVATDATGARITRSMTLTISSLAISNLGIAAGDVLPPATSGVPYNYQFTCVTPCPGATWTITNGFLPGGLTLSPVGAIAGTTFIGFPQTNEFSIFVTVTSGGRSVTRRFALDVLTDDPWPLSGAPDPVLQDQLVGQTTTINLSTNAIGGTPPYTFALAPGSSLPAGLQLAAGASRVAPTFSPINTLIVGAPTTAGLYTFDLDISDHSMPVQTIRRTFTLRVSNITITTGTTIGIPSPRVGVAYSFQFTTVGGSGSYTYQIDPATNFQGISNLPPGLTLSAAGLLAGTATGSGVYTFRVVAQDTTPPNQGGPYTFSRIYTVQVADFVNGGVSGGLFIGQGSASGAITSPNPADTPVGVWADTFFTLFRVNGPPVSASWSIVGSLPPGLSLMGDGIQGRPSTAGTYVFRVRGTDLSNNTQFAEHEYTWRITPMQVVSPALGFSFGDRVSLPNGQVGAPYSFRFRVAGGTGPYTFSLPVFPASGNIVPGLTLDSAGVLSGTPTQSGTFFMGFTVEDSTGKQGFAGGMQLIIAPAGGHAPLIVDDDQNAESPVPMGVDFGTSFLARLDTLIRSGVAPFTWSVAPGSNLPPGAAIVSGGGLVSDIIAGKPTTPGTYAFTLNVVDGAGQMASVFFHNVRVTSLSIAPLRLPTGVVGTPYNAQLTPSGGTPPYGPLTFIEGSSVPLGLTISPTGAISGTPGSAGNYLLAAVYGDSVSMEYMIYRLTIDTATTAGEAKAVSLSPAAIDVSRPLGAPTAGIPLNVNITSGHPAFTAVITGIPGATISANAGTTPAVLTVNLPTEALAQGVYHGMVGVKVNGTANIDEVTPIIVTIGPPPVVQAISVTPNTGTGVRQTFTATYSDSVGVATDLKRAMLRIGASGVNGCVVDYNAMTTTVRLFDDTGVPGSPAALGSAGTLSNTQCTLNLATSTATPAGNNLTLALDISFAAAFAGAQPLAVRATSNAGQNTGFVNKGTWTVGLPGLGVQVGTITPINGSGLTQNFVLTYSDSAGVAADLVAARVRFRAASGIQCGIAYSAMTNQVRVLDDAGVFSAPSDFGAGSINNNSQCILDLSQSSAVRNGTDLTLTLRITFKTPAFQGTHNVDMRANSNFGPTTGWVNKGTWQVP